MANQVFKEGNRIGEDKVRVHRGGNRIDGVSNDKEMFYNDLPIPKRSKINLSFDRKLSFDMGKLVPVLCQECVPGDTFHIAQAHNLMLAPLVAPCYQRIDYRTYYFFVPTRLVDDGWKDFITMQNPSYVIPYFTGAQIKSAQSLSSFKNTLLDYIDLPVQQTQFVTNTRHLCAHIPRAYNLIWNEFFRDEFKQTEVTISKTGSQISNTEAQTYVVRNIGWEKDYFTTAQTTPQVGADVSLPVGINQDPNSALDFYKDRNSSTAPASGAVGLSQASTYGVLQDSAGNAIAYKSGLITTGTINDLRTANHLQELRDKLKIGGARYNEAILSEYGVVVPDYRIQRPEYIGGYASPVEIGRVMQTSPSGSDPLGSYAGSGTGRGKMDYIHYNCYEHGYIIGLSVVMPRSSYTQGIPRVFMKDDYFRYYHPDLATLGDQEIFDDEIWVRSNLNNSRFGYQQRYAEYKYPNGGHGDSVNGEFRDSLSFWHMSREFNSLPALNSSFIEADPTTRVFAQNGLANYIYAEIYQEIDAVRPMPVAVQPNLTNVE